MSNYPGLRRKAVHMDAGHSGRPWIARPANDNWRVPAPANDNIPFRSARLTPSMTQFRRATALTGLNQGFRLLAAGMAVYELGRSWYDFAQGSIEAATEQWIQDANWEQTRGPCSVPGGGGTFYEWLGSGLAPGACLTGQAVDPAERTTDPDGYPAANRDGLNIWVYTNCPPIPGASYADCNAADPAFPRFGLEASYRKFVTGLPNLPAPHFETVQVNYVPFFPPAGDVITDPMVLPIGQPVPLPRPVPVRQMHVHRRLHEKAMEWQSPTRINPRIVPQRVWAPPGTMPVLREDILPEQNIQVYPRQARLALDEGHKFEPPPPGVKERKFVVAIPRAMGIAVNLVTESMDVVDALYDAIPKKYHRGESYEGKRSMKAKAQAVYTHYGVIDVAKALDNLLANNAGDMIRGKTSKRLRSSYQFNYNAYGLRGGYQLGPAL